MASSPDSQLDETAPAGSDNASAGDDAIRLFKKQVRQRMVHGGHLWEDAASGPTTIETESARHACGVDTADQFIIYETDGTTPAVTVDDDGADDNDPRLVTLGDGKAGSVSYSLVAEGVDCTDLTGQREHLLSVAIPGNSTGRINGVMFVNTGAVDITLLGATAYCFVKPVGAALEIDVHLITITDTDTNPLTEAGDTIANSAPLLTIADGKFNSDTEVTSFATAALAQGEAWVFEIDQVGSGTAGDGIVIMLRVRKTV